MDCKQRRDVTRTSTATRSTWREDPDAFPAPKWPTQTLVALIEITFAGRIIETASNPALLRLIGAKPSVS